MIKAAPLRGTAARPSPGSALGRPPGTGALCRYRPLIKMTHQQAHARSAERRLFLGFQCPARGHRV
jgi:hypothetical protein